MYTRLFTVAILVTAFISSCDIVRVALSPTSTPTETPIPLPSFKGRLIVGHPDGMFALVNDSATATLKEIEIPAKWSDTVSVSPDFHFLISSDVTEGTQIVDLSTYQVTNLFPDLVDCLQWASDSKRFVFRYRQTPSIYIYDITSKTPTLIYAPPSATYLTTIQYGDVQCPYWIGKNRLLFDRFIGSMPSSITIPGAPELAANTTSLAVIGDEIKIIDSPERVYLIDVSDDETLVLISKQDQIYIANSFDDFTNMNLRSLAHLPIRDTSGQFISKSNGIIVENDHEIFFLDRESLETTQTFSKPPDWQLYSFRNGEWMGSPNDAIIIWDLNGNLVIGDLKTGIKTEFWQISKYGFANWIAWMP